MDDGENEALPLAVLREHAEALLDLDGEMREKALHGLAVTRTDRARIRRMLEDAVAEGDGFLDPPEAHRHDGGAAPGERVGPWRLVSVLGAGGMGIVWRAARADGAYVAEVALKRMHVQRHGAEDRVRFQRELQILAELDHPGIARLVDGGEDAEGHPFLAMEFVDGVRIDEHCDARRMDVRERVELLARVARAVDAAHARRIVHGDLKPANLLVRPDGAPRVIDFGVAKVLDPRSAAALHSTSGVARHLTPAYASPEQVQGADLTPAADVHALGALGFELLVGRLPYDIEGRPPAEAARRIAEDDAHDLHVAAGGANAEVRAAARGRTPGDLARLVAGDLTAILGTALRKDPSERYARAGDLADELDRWLAGRSVLARPEGRWSRTLRFVRRHTAVVGLTAAVVIALAGGLFVALLQRAELVERGQELEARGRETRRLLEDLRGMVVGLVSDDYPGLAAVPENQRIVEHMVRDVAAVAARQDDPVLLTASVEGLSLAAQMMWNPLHGGEDPARARRMALRAERTARELLARDEPLRGGFHPVGLALVQSLRARYHDGEHGRVLEAAEAARADLDSVASDPEPWRRDGGPVGALEADLAKFTLDVELLRARSLDGLGARGEAISALERALEGVTAGGERDGISERLLSAKVGEVRSLLAVLLGEAGREAEARIQVDEARFATAHSVAGHTAMTAIDDRARDLVLLEAARSAREGRVQEAEERIVAELSALEASVGAREPDRFELWGLFSLGVELARLRVGRGASGTTALAMDALDLLGRLHGERALAWSEAARLADARLVAAHALVLDGRDGEAGALLGRVLEWSAARLEVEPRARLARELAVEARLLAADAAADPDAARGLRSEALEQLEAAPWAASAVTPDLLRRLQDALR